MLKDMQAFIEKNKHKKLFKSIVTILSCFTIILTISFLTLPAFTEEEPITYKFKLRDNYVYDWKDSTYATSYDLDLYFFDTTGKNIEGKDVTFELKPDGLIDSPYGFGFVPYSDSTLTTSRGANLIEALTLEKYISSTGERYEFDHAEVLIGENWQVFDSTGTRWHIWCQFSSSETKPSDYGWRGSYGVSGTNYTINENTKFKFVYKEVGYGISNSVSSIGGNSGITFKMFNYSGDNGSSGDNNINNNGVYDYFTFRGLKGTNQPESKINGSLDADGFINSTRIRVLPKLDATKNPVYDCRNTDGCTNFSLGYLYGSNTNPLNDPTRGVTSYNPNNTLLRIDESGNYYYDSNMNAVDYDVLNNRFMLRDYLERSYDMTTYQNEENRWEFMPFNYWNSFSTTKTNGSNSRVYNYENSESGQIDHWFGMTMEFNFYMPKDGILNDNDMIFSFSGDDDVWVFIDDVLVLDLGGTHGAVDGYINFKTGEVKSYLNWEGINSSDEEDSTTGSSTNIYEMFSNANELDSTAWKNNTFENYTYHTLKFFYLERGASVSNCKIKFNMPVLPAGSISVTKQFSGTDNYNDDYEFTIYDTTNEITQPVSNAKYIVDEQEYYTDENGKFYLKKDQTALFILNNYHSYYVEETNSGLHSKSLNCTLDEINCPYIDKTGEFTINPDSQYAIVFTNEVKKYNVNIDKIVYYNDSQDDFEFEFYLRDVNNLPVDIPDAINSEYLVDHVNGIVTFNLKNGENVTIRDIPIDTICTLKEINHDGYQVLIKNGDIILSNSHIYENFRIDSDKTMTVHNTPGVILPETGGNGILWYLFIGISLILISIKFGYKYLLSSNRNWV